MAQSIVYVFVLVVSWGVCAAQDASNDGSIYFFGPCNNANNGSCDKRTNNITFGGYFPLYEWDYVASKCVRSMEHFQPEEGLLRLEAMRWALKRYRGNLDVGFDLRDSCSKDTHTRDSALDFINVGTDCQEQYAGRPISLTIGTASSTVSADLTSLLTLFGVSQISYGATANSLNATASSDQERFDSFFRTVPPDSYQLRAIADLVLRSNWKFVTLVHANDLFGQSARNWLTNVLSAKSQFCLAATIPLDTRNSASQDVYRNAVAKLTTGVVKNSKVVIIFAGVAATRKFFEAALAGGLDPKEYVWIASDAWAGNVRAFPANHTDKFEGRVISFHPYAPLDADFETHMRNTPQREFPNISWYRMYFDHLFNGSYSGNSTAGESPLFHIENKVPFVIQAVQIGLQVVKSILETNCSDIAAATCPQGELITAAATNNTLKEKLKASTFDLSADGMVRYDDATRSYLPTNDGEIKYVIQHFRRVNGTASFVGVGNWACNPHGASTNGTPGILCRNRDTLRGLAVSSDLEALLSQSSFCSDPCGNGQVIKPTPGYFRTCCWECRDCDANQISSGELCELCDAHTKPSTNQTLCEPLASDYTLWTDAFGIVILVITLLALVLSTVVVLVFAAKWKTPLVRASSRELSIMLFVGFYLSCGIALIFVSKPTPPTCGLRRIGLGVSLTLCLAALLVKTNRISRVFNRKPSQPRPSYVSPEWQVLFTCLLTGIQLTIVVVWVVVQPPKAEDTVITPNSKVQLKCNEGHSAGLYVSLAYNLLLMIIVTVYGFRTRKIPENFNEARYISFSMYTIVVVWLGFVPAYFATSAEFESSFLGLPLIISIVSMLGFLFIPKLYVIVFDSDRNNRQNFIAQSSSTGRHRRSNPTPPGNARDSVSQGRERRSAAGDSAKVSQ